MSDEHDPEEEEGAEGTEDSADLPEDDKGLGLTEEFARIEAEIDAEIGRTGDPLAGDDVEGDEDAEVAPERPAIRWDDDDSAEWEVPPVPPVARSEGGEGGGTEEWAAPDQPDADAEPDAAADSEHADGVHGEEIPEDPYASDLPPVDEPASEHTVVRPRPLVPAGVGAGGGGGGEYIPDEDLENRTSSLWWRFMAGSVVIVAAVATAVSLASLLFLTDVAAELQPIPNIQEKLTELDPGEPQTILIIGSDKRSGTPGDPGRSDTTMLLRVDAENHNLSLFSLPRDLKVDIAGRNFPEAKLNEAFTDGGVKKTLATVQNLTGLDINQVVNIDFQGFADAVDAIGCVYVDIDRKYFNDNSDYGEDYATIDINPGYQRLCGSDALDYVRYRHTDTTFVRDARQQDFLRNARAQVPISELAPPVFGGSGTSSDLIDIFTHYTQSSIHTSAQIIGLLKSFLVVKDVPVNEVHFEGSDVIENGISYVTASDEEIHKAVGEFLGDKDSQGSRGGENANQSNAPSVNDGEKQQKKKQKKEADSAQGADVISTADSSAATTGVDKYAAFGGTSARRLKFPVYVPTVVAPGSSYDPDSRQYQIKDPDLDKVPAYKMVIALENPAVNEEFYGVEGTTWKDPPILKDPTSTISKDGRDYDLYYDGDRLRMVAFHDDLGNSYWVSNTLLQTLDESQMLAIAESMQEAHG